MGLGTAGQIGATASLMRRRACTSLHSLFAFGASIWVYCKDYSKAIKDPEPLNCLLWPPVPFQLQVSMDIASGAEKRKSSLNEF